MAELHNLSGNTSVADSIWILFFCLWFLFLQITGGTSATEFELTVAHAVSSAVLIAWSIIRLQNGFKSKLALWAWLAAVSLYLISFLQLVPLAPSIWTNLPGRDVIRDIVAQSGGDLPWLPLSISPNTTRESLVAVLPGLAGFTAALTLSRKDFGKIASVFLCCALISVLAAVLQKAGRWPIDVPLLAPNTPGIASGTFFNKNFYASQLFACIPWLAVSAIAMQERLKFNAAILYVLFIVYIGIMIVGLAASGSRAGVVLAMPSVLLTLLFVYRRAAPKNVARGSVFAAAATIGTIILISQASMIGILRLAKTDLSADYRSTISEISLNTAQAFWPAGSGYGTFVSAYQMHEKPSAMINNYVNEAHNDWLQLVLEGGAIGLLSIIAFLALYAVGFFQMIKHNQKPDLQSTAVRAGFLVTLLLGFHAIVDFGLRTPALMTLFAVSCGVACLAGRYEGNTWRPASPKASPGLSKSDSPRSTVKHFQRKPQGTA